VSGGTLGRYFAQSTFGPSKPNAQQVKEQLFPTIHTLSAALAVKEINQKAPYMIDGETRLDRAEASPNSVTYFHTFPNYSSKDVEFSHLQTNLLPKIINFVCSDEDMKWVMSYDVEYIYVYRGNNEKEIARFEITKNDCNL